MKKIFSKKRKYNLGFYTKIRTEEFKKGLNKDIIYKISEKRKEPSWMLNFRIKAYQTWKKMKEPHWLKGKYRTIDYNKYSYYSAPKYINNTEQNSIERKKHQNSKKQIKNTFTKLGVPIKKNSTIAVDAIFDSVSVFTTSKKEISNLGIIFCSFNEAIHNYPDLVKKYLGYVVPIGDNFFSTLNSAVASDGTFIYIPKNVRCPIDLSTYFRINSKKTNQFERTILIADEGSYVSYIEGCSAPIRKKNQLHAAVVEVILLKNSTVKYATVQNWYSGKNKSSGILNFVTKRALCEGENSKMSWAQSETGSSITWKYPSVILKGNNSRGKFFSVSFTSGFQQADTGTKMIHIGKNTKSTIISKGISTNCSSNTYRGLVSIKKTAKNSHNFTQCDSILVGEKCSSHTFPSIKVDNKDSIVEHEASTSKIGERQIFYCTQRGMNEEEAISIIIHGFCKEIFLKFPLEFAIEAQELLSVNLENTVG